MRTITAIIVIIISFSISVINLVIVNNSAIVFRIITLVQSLGIITIISSSISVIQLHHQQNHPMKITFFIHFCFSHSLHHFNYRHYGIFFFTVVIIVPPCSFSSSFCHFSHSSHQQCHHRSHFFCHTGATTTNISVIITVYIYNIATCCISLPS